MGWPSKRRRSFRTARGASMAKAKRRSEPLLLGGEGVFMWSEIVFCSLDNAISVAQMPHFGQSVINQKRFGGMRADGYSRRASAELRKLTLIGVLHPKHCPLCKADIQWFGIVVSKRLMAGRNDRRPSIET